MADFRSPVNRFSEYLDGRMASTPVEKVTSEGAETVSSPVPPRMSSGFSAFLDTRMGKETPSRTTSPETAVPVPSEEGMLSRMGKAFQLGEATAQQQTGGLTRDLSAVLERNIGPYRDQIRQSLGLPVEQDAEARAREIEQSISTPEILAEKTLTDLHGFSTMTTNDVHGVLSGVQYAMEAVASSGAQMLPILATGGLGIPLGVAMQSAQVNEELKTRVPQLTDEQRLSVSLGAGLAMSSLDFLGMGAIFGRLAPVDVAKMASMKTLANYMSRQGLAPATARIVQTAIVEGTTESLQEAINMTAVELSGGQLQQGEIAYRLRESFFGGLAAGGAIRTPIEALGDGGERDDDTPQAPVGPVQESMEAKVDLESYSDSDLGTGDGTPFVDTEEVPVVPDAVTVSDQNATLQPAPVGGDGAKPPAMYPDKPPYISESALSPVPGQPPMEKGQISTAETLPENTFETLEDVGAKNPAEASSGPVELSPIDEYTTPENMSTAVTVTGTTPTGNTVTDKLAMYDEIIWGDLPEVLGIEPEVISGSSRMFDVYKAIRQGVIKQITHGGMDDESFSAVARNLMHQTLQAGAPPEFVSYLRRNLQRPENHTVKNYLTYAAEAQAYGELRADLDKVGLNETALVFTNKPGSEGFYSKLVNAVAVKITNQEGITVGHEAIHALKNLGAFDRGRGKQAWDVLVNYVNTNMPDEVIGGLEQYIANGLTAQDLTEEKIAELYGQYNNVRNAKLKYAQWKVPGIVKEALALIRKGFEVVQKWVQQYSKSEIDYDNITKPWEALEAIARGKITPQMKAIGGQEWEALRKQTSTLHRFGRTKGAKALQTGADYYGFLVKWGWTITQLAKKNLHISWLQSYVQQANRWYNEKMAWLSRADETVSMWVNLGLEQQNAVTAAIWEVDQMDYLTPAEKQANVVRLPTKQELGRIFAKHKLNAKSIGVYLKIRKDFDAVLDKMEQVAIRDATRVLGPIPASLSVQVAAIQHEFRKLRARPFFPHARFGDYLIVVKDQKTGKPIYIEAFDTERARNAAYSNVGAKFKSNPDAVMAGSMFPQELRIFKQLPQSFLLALKHTLNLTPAQEAELNDMIIAMAPSSSFKTQFYKQSNIEGYSRDALRAYADYFWHGANHIARVVYGPEMEGAIRDADKDVEALTLNGVDATSRVKIADYLRHHLDNIMNPKPDWNMLRSVTFLWYLGFNLKSAVMNFTQVPMVTYPHLAAQFGDTATIRALTGTYTRLRKIYASTKNYQKLFSPQEAKMFALGVEQGFLDESMAQQLAGIAEGGNLLRTRAGSPTHKMLLKGQELAGLMFQLTEKINRKVTFFATLDLAKRHPNAKYLREVRQQYNIEFLDLVSGPHKFTPEEATAFLAAKDAVRSSQFEYAQWSRPRFMEGRKGAFFTFFMFMQHMLWFMQNNPGNIRYLLVLLGTAGVMGLPFADDLNEFAKWIGRNLFGKEWNLEKEMYAAVREWTDAPPDLLVHGVSRYGFGLKHLGDLTGIPLPAVDLSANLGMGSPVPIISPAIQALGRQGNFNDKMSAFTSEAVGPTFGIGISTLKAIADTDANPRRWEQTLPTAVGNISKAYNQWKEGEIKLRGGGQLLPFDRNDPEHVAELVAQSLGFTPTRVSQAWDLRIAQIEASQFWTVRRSLLLLQLDQAKVGGDPRDMADAKAAINRFNQGVPFPQLKLTPKTISRSLKQREIVRQRREAGLPDAKMLGPVYKELEQLYPNPKGEVKEAVEDIK